MRNFLEQRPLAGASRTASARRDAPNHPPDQIRPGSATSPPPTRQYRRSLRTLCPEVYGPHLGAKLDVTFPQPVTLHPDESDSSGDPVLKSPFSLAPLYKRGRLSSRPRCPNILTPQPVGRVAGSSSPDTSWRDSRVTERRDDVGSTTFHRSSEILSRPIGSLPLHRYETGMKQAVLFGPFGLMSSTRVWSPCPMSLPRSLFGPDLTNRTRAVTLSQERTLFALFDLLFTVLSSVKMLDLPATYAVSSRAGKPEPFRHPISNFPSSLLHLAECSLLSFQPAGPVSRSPSQFGPTPAIRTHSVTRS